tara:strand:- start:18139 stop:18603 length:465 start_codon:yes stop_codon:yes gene_type:complete
MEAATLGVPRVTAALGCARLVQGISRMPQASARARVPVRAVAERSRATVGGNTFADLHRDTAGIRNATTNRPASWTKAVRLNRGAENINRATAPNGACLFRDVRSHAGIDSARRETPKALKNASRMRTWSNGRQRTGGSDDEMPQRAARRDYPP